MPVPSEEQKAKARQNEDRAGKVTDLAPAAAFGAGFIPAAGIFVAGGIVVLGSAVALFGRRQKRIADDPPRDDFGVPTELEPPFFEPSLLGDSPFASAVAQFIRAEDQAARLSEAFVVALERASGAEAAGNFGMREERTAEAIRFASELSTWLDAAAETTGAVQAELRPYAVGDFPRPNVPTTLGDALDADTAALVQEAGVMPAELTVPIEYLPENPVQDLIDAIGDLADMCHESAQGLREALEDGTLLDETGSAPLA